MARGKRPDAAIDEAKKFSERMGYRWQENTHPDVAYDLFLFKKDSARIVKVRTTRYRIEKDTYYEDLLPDELREVRRSQCLRSSALGSMEDRSGTLHGF